MYKNNQQQSQPPYQRYHNEHEQQNSYAPSASYAYSQNGPYAGMPPAGQYGVAPSVIVIEPVPFCSPSTQKT